MYCGIQIFLTMRENVGSKNWEIQKVRFLEYEGKNFGEIWETKGVFDGKDFQTLLKHLYVTIDAKTSPNYLIEWLNSCLYSHL